MGYRGQGADQWQDSGGGRGRTGTHASQVSEMELGMAAVRSVLSQQVLVSASENTKAVQVGCAAQKAMHVVTF